MASWELSVPPIVGDNGLVINQAIQSLSAMDGGGKVLLEPAVYSLQTPIQGASNVFLRGAFCGAHLFDSTVALGTILRWTGSPAAAVVLDAPASGASRIDGGGLSDVSIDCAGLTGTGLQDMSSYMRRYSRIHVVGARSYAYYFGTVYQSFVNPNYHSRLDSLTAVALGNTHGIVLDGAPGSGLDTAFLSARNCHITFQNGVAYCLSNADNCGFLDCAASKMVDATGAAIWFGGSSDGSGKCACSNRFLGFHHGNGTISAAGGNNPARGNYVLTNSMDGVPVLYADKAHGATLAVDCYDGESGFNGVVFR